MGMEEDALPIGSDLGDEMPALRSVSNVAATEAQVDSAEVATAKEIIEEKLQRSKSVKAELESSVDVKGDDLLDFLVEKAGNYIKKHPDLFANLSASVLEKGVLKTICVSILPTLTENAGKIIQNAPSLIQDIRKNPGKWASVLLKVGGVACMVLVLVYSGIVSADNIPTLFNVMMDPTNGTAVEL